MIVLAQFSSEKVSVIFTSFLPIISFFVINHKKDIVFSTRKMGTRNVLYYLAVGFLIMGLFMGEVEARRKILRGRKHITRRYYSGTSIAAWSIVLIVGLVMLLLGGGLYVLLKKTIVDGSGESGTNSYHPAMQDEV